MLFFPTPAQGLSIALLLGAGALLPVPAVAPVDPGAPPTSHATAATATLTLAGAQQVLDAATAEARRLGAGGAFAVVDAAGDLVCLDRLDGTFGAAAAVSTGKARTAARFRKPTSVFEDAINQGRTAMAGMPDFTPLRGGVPIVVDGQMVGAIGVSGAMNAQQDEELAQAGANALGGNSATKEVAR